KKIPPPPPAPPAGLIFTKQTDGKATGADNAGSNPVFVYIWWKGTEGEETIAHIAVRHNETPEYAVRSVAEWRKRVMATGIPPLITTETTAIDQGYPTGATGTINALTNAANDAASKNSAPQVAPVGKPDLDFDLVTRGAKHKGDDRTTMSHPYVQVTFWWLENKIVWVFVDHDQTSNRMNPAVDLWTKTVMENQKIPDIINPPDRSDQGAAGSWYADITSRVTLGINAMINSANEAATKNPNFNTKILRQQAVDAAIAMRQAELQQHWENSQTEALLVALNTAAQEAVSKNQARSAANKE
ncbi:MAG: hypothetical protein FWD91_04205, partial [Treponema sp.]|nr:hypothetical protein [Treponema sp.]